MSTILFITLHAATMTQSRSEHFLASTVVVCTELVKLLLSLYLSFYFDGHLDFKTFLDCLVKAFVDDGIDVLKLSLPAILYTIQNNLQYIIESAPLFLVLYQSKIVTTAAFFTLMLSRRLSIKEWCVILTLAIGVSIVESSQHEIVPHHASNVVGMLSVITACLTSGFAGVSALCDMYMICEYVWYVFMLSWEICYGTSLIQYETGNVYKSQCYLLSWRY